MYAVAAAKKLQLPEFSLWSRVSSVVINYGIACLIFNVIYWHFFGIRYTIRALDVVVIFAQYEDITVSKQMQLLVEATIVLVSCYYAVRSGVLFYGVLLNVKRIRDETDPELLEVGSSCGVDGQQGVGKTRLLVYMMVLHCTVKMRNLALKYFTDYPIRNNLLEAAQNGDDVDWIAFKNREDAFNFYFRENPGRIGGAYSNILVTWNNKKPHYLQRKHFTMEQRLHESNVKLLSEADNVLANTMRKSNGKKKKDDEEDNEANAIDEFVGLDRQYTDGLLLTDSHANGAIFKSIRDCQQVKLHLLKSEYKYCPKILKWYHKRLEDKVLQAQLGTTLQLRKKLKDVEASMRKIGFTRIYYIKETGVDKIKNLSDVKFMVLPNQVPYSYNDRVLQKQYPHAPQVPKK